VMLIDVIINNRYDRDMAPATLVGLLQVLESANSAIMDATICTSLQLYTNALCKRREGQRDSNLEAIILTGASSLIELFSNQFELLFRYLYIYIYIFISRYNVFTVVIKT